MRKVWRLIVVALLGLPAVPTGAGAQDLLPTGRWDATVTVNDIDIPFTFVLEGSATAPVGVFFDGAQRIESTAGRFDHGALTLTFGQFGTRLDAVVADGHLRGFYDRGTRGRGYPFRADPAGAVAGLEAGPDITGVWIVPTTSSKGERAFRFIVRQQGGEVAATMLRVDGDTGTLSGSYHDGAFTLSHFSGVRPSRFDVRPGADGTLTITQAGQKPLLAIREEAARAADLPQPSDNETHTRVKDASAPLDLAFPDLDGHRVSLADARFRGKVVVVSITGSWCPNCHDEAPFLSELYRRYRGLGLEVLAVSFEEAEQLRNPVRVRGFAKRYGIEYPIVLAGEPDELNAKVPQFENLNAFPTSFYLGRDGRVRLVHAGFPSPASGPFYQEARQHIVEQVEHLLAEPDPTAGPNVGRQVN